MGGILGLTRLAQLASTLRDRFGHFYLGLIALGVGVLFAYSGARGLRAYIAGVRAAWTEPWVGLLGVAAGAWMLLMSVRLFRGPGEHRPTLLSQSELLVLSLGVIAGSLWSFTFAPPKQAVMFVATGLAGLGRWWFLHRRTRSSFRPPAA